MGKRKRATPKLNTRVTIKTPKVFNCPYCHNKACVKVKIETDENEQRFATLHCSYCSNNSLYKSKYDVKIENLTMLDDPPSIYKRFMDRRFLIDCPRCSGSHMVKDKITPVAVDEKKQETQIKHIAYFVCLGNGEPKVFTYEIPPSYSLLSMIKKINEKLKEDGNNQNNEVENSEEPFDTDDDN